MTCQTGLQTAPFPIDFLMTVESLRVRSEKPLWCRRDNHTDTIPDTTSSQLARGCAAERDHTHTTHHEKRRSPRDNGQNMLIKIHDHDTVAVQTNSTRSDTTTTRNMPVFFLCTPCAQRSTVALASSSGGAWSQVVKVKRQPLALESKTLRLSIHCGTSLAACALEFGDLLIKMMARVPPNAARLINPRFRDFPLTHVVCFTSVQRHLSSSAVFVFTLLPFQF